MGSSYALLTEDALVFGPGKTGQLRWVEPGSKDQLATFQGNHMIVFQGRSYLHSDASLQAIDRERYLELARQRRDLYAYRQKLNDQLKQLKKDSPGDLTEKTEAIQKELVDIARSLDQIGQDMEGCLLWNVPCEFPYGMSSFRGYSLHRRQGQGGSLRQLNRVTHFGRVRSGRALGLASVHGRLVVKAILDTFSASSLKMVTTLLPQCNKGAPECG